MRLPSENKARAGQCHYCGRAIGWPECRQEPLGWFCRQRGLQLGEGVELFGPERVVESWERSPEVLAAAETEDAALVAFTAADQAWQDAYQRVAQRRDRPQSRWWVLDRGSFVPKAAGKDQQLDDAEVEAKRAREAAGEALRAARAAHHDALQLAIWQHRTQQPAAA